MIFHTTFPQPAGCRAEAQGSVSPGLINVYCPATNYTPQTKLGTSQLVYTDVDVAVWAQKHALKMVIQLKGFTDKGWVTERGHLGILS